MQAHEIFQHLAPELSRDIFSSLRAEEKAGFRDLVGSLAQQRKLRPAFVLKKTPQEQYDWLAKTCRLKPMDGFAEQLLQLWLLKARGAMLTSFLDMAGISHDGKGGIDDLPETLDGEKLNGAIDKILEEYPADHVKLYLHVFQLQKPGGWDALKAILESDERLQFS
ncbi:MAG: hypothetical protein R3F31_13290 [Verrucomicrobiales bacterium]|nr:hypothetical protein [Verrucomicrobiae bacterium]MCP5554634.1 hypothetical protein [Akkermansiaceae bacterium]HRX53228.1 hypothetical protein [Verrucomicrobiales bacterium]